MTALTNRTIPQRFEVDFFDFSMCIASQTARGQEFGIEGIFKASNGWTIGSDSYPQLKSGERTLWTRGRTIFRDTEELSFMNEPAGLREAIDEYTALAADGILYVKNSRALRKYLNDRLISLSNGFLLSDDQFILASALILNKDPDSITYISSRGVAF